MNRLLALSLAVLVFPGCDTGPTYEEALAAYSTEKELLDDLLKERATAVAVANSMQGEVTREYEKTSNEIRDQLIELEQIRLSLGKDESSNDEAKANADKILSSARTKSNVKIEDIGSALKDSLSILDAKIESQRDRVEKAEQLRNSLER